jgi:hypothetical protein
MTRSQPHLTCICLAAATALTFTPAASAAGGGPRWTIGRAVIVAARQGMPSSPALHLKLSLRNVGMPGRIPVSIFGRWSAMQAARRGARSGGMPMQPAWQGPGGTTSGSPASGRWSQAPAMPSAHAVRPGGGLNAAESPAIIGGRPAGMRLLGRYVREVSLTNTAILEIPLPARSRRGEHRFEIVVMSGPVLTDHQFINATD